MVDEKTFFIGELASRSGVSRDTIRYYESEGVLPEPARSPAGYRLYGLEDVDRLEFVGQAQTLGLLLDEIADVLEIADDGREPCVHVRRTLESRLKQTRRRIRRLKALKRRLQQTLARASSAGTDDDGACRCPIIEKTEDGAGRQPAPKTEPRD